MNMKKTIAAIAAGAVAVSAMATTVSALEAKTLTYNLVKTTKKQDAKGTVTATFTNVPLAAGGKFIVEPVSQYGANSWDTMVTISGSFWDDAAGTNKSFVPVVATGMNWETGYSIEGSKLWNGSIVEVPVVAGTAQGTNVALKATSSAVITVTVKFPNLPDSVNYVGALNELIRDGKVGIKVTSLESGAQYSTGAAGASANYSAAGWAGQRAITVKDSATAVKLGNIAQDWTLNAAYKWVTAGAPAKADVTNVNIGHNTTPMTDASKVTVSGGPATASGSITLTYDGTTNWVDTSGNTWTVTDTSGVTAVAGDTVTVNATPAKAEGTADHSADVYAAFDILNVVAVGDELHIYTWGEGSTAPGLLYSSALSGAATETAGNSEKKVPYRSTLKNSIYGTPWNAVSGSINTVLRDSTPGSGDVLAWIGYANSSTDEGIYDSTSMQITDAARSVINDAVQNYNDVVFTFNTATSNVKITYAADGSIKDYEYVTDDAKARYLDNGTYYEIVNYTAFGRHFWDRDTGYDANTLYINNEWLGNNLFEGALIVNNNITLSLGATDKFDWTATSLSFSWDAIQDASLTQNQYANYIQNMVLRTSTDWFWDNMTVALGETETEEVDSGAPVEGNTEDLDEDEDEDFDFGDEDEDEDPVVDTTPDPEPEPEPTPVVASNPSTGNASVALAVIPVALAAAAIVAKKRG